MRNGVELDRALLVTGAESVALAPPATELSVTPMVSDTTDRGMQGIKTITGLVGAIGVD
ncbi:MAG: hypothetical protein ABIU95_16495 [Burkholderiales bacterium]